MPVTIVVTTVEAEALVDAKIEGIEGPRFTYNPSESGTILNALTAGEGRDRLASRFASIAVTLGIPDSMFTPAPEPVALEPLPEAIDAEKEFFSPQDGGYHELDPIDEIGHV